MTGLPFGRCVFNDHGGSIGHIWIRHCGRLIYVQEIMRNARLSGSVLELALQARTTSRFRVGRRRGSLPLHVRRTAGASPGPGALG